MTRNPITDFARLRNSAFDAFRNEYLIRVNCYRRREIALTRQNAFFTVMALGPDKHLRHYLYMVRWILAALVQTFLLLAVPRTRLQKRFALITTPRQIPHVEGDWQFLRVGIHNCRFHAYPHLLASLGRLEVLRGFFNAIRWRQEILNACAKDCRQHDIDPVIFRKLCNLGLLRIADYLLTVQALQKTSADEVATCIQLECYVNWMSIARESGASFNMIGFQHGLFECPSPGFQYHKPRFDTYHLLFPESELWLRDNYLGKPNCDIRMRKTRGKIDWQQIDRDGFDYVIAYAAQDVLPCDIENIDRILAYAENTNALVLLYPHPTWPDFPVERWLGSGRFQVHPSARHNNIDLMVTRFSTLGMNYLESASAPPLFVPHHSELCVFSNPNITVCRDPAKMQDHVLTLLQNNPGVE